MTDIVERLHELAHEYHQHRPHYTEAAAEIERLRAELDALRDPQEFKVTLSKQQLPAALEEKQRQVNYWGDRCCKAEAQRDKLLAALNLTMLGGNHLANVLIGRLGAGFATQYPPDLDHEIALQMLGATDTHGVWCCWAAIMTARAAIAAVANQDANSKVKG